MPPSPLYGQITIINSPPNIIGDDESIGANTRLNVLEGGGVGFSFDANSGSETNISGGTVGHNFRANFGSEVTISGGNVGHSFQIGNGSTVHLSGGTVGDGFKAGFGSSQLNISGGEFRLGGQLIAGLTQVGASQSIVVPNSTLLSGTLADGTPFAFLSNDFDNFASTTLTLNRTALPSIGLTTISVNSNQAPLGIRNGQTLNLNSSGIIANNFNAGLGSHVNVFDHATVHDNLEAVGSHVQIHGGSVGDNLDAFQGSTVEVLGGSVGSNFDVFGGSVVRVLGGSVGSFARVDQGSRLDVTSGTVGAFLTIGDDSTLNIHGSGSVGDFLNADGGSELFISGGSVGNFAKAQNSSSIRIVGGSIGDKFKAESGSTLTIAGGSIGSEFTARAGSNIHLEAMEFFLDGAPIAGLTDNSRTIINQRDAVLSGTFINGEVFSFDLNSTEISGMDFIDAAATLTVTKVAIDPDFNNDNSVDEIDLGLWQAAFEVNSGGDADSDGDSDGADFLHWQREHSGSNSPIGELQIVPEPTAFGLCILAFLSVLPLLRRAL